MDAMQALGLHPWPPTLATGHPDTGEAQSCQLLAASKPEETADFPATFPDKNRHVLCKRVFHTLSF